LKHSLEFIDELGNGQFMSLVFLEDHLKLTGFHNEYAKYNGKEWIGSPEKVFFGSRMELISSVREELELLFYGFVEGMLEEHVLKERASEIVSVTQDVTKRARRSKLLRSID
jgi:hypothetical protein